MENSIHTGHVGSKKDRKQHIPVKLALMDSRMWVSLTKGETLRVTKDRKLWKAIIIHIFERTWHEEEAL